MTMSLSHRLAAKFVGKAFLGGPKPRDLAGGLPWWQIHCVQGRKFGDDKPPAGAKYWFTEDLGDKWGTEGHRPARHPAESHSSMKHG
jgi:hypothetical protein